MKAIFLFLIVCCSFVVSAQTTGVLKPTEKDALVTFIITDYDSIPESNAVLTITSKDGTFKKVLTSDVDGKCEMLLAEGKEYRMSVLKFGVAFDFDEMLAIPLEEGAIMFDQSLKIRVVKKYTRVYRLEHVYFDTNKFDLKPESDEALKALKKTLQDHPTMKIEIAGHTDDVGDDESNMRLSQRRADAVVLYLIQNGISSLRLVSKGYGERMPVVPNTSAEGRSKNRRTEVRVIQE